MKKLLLLLILVTGFTFISKSSHVVGGDTQFIQTGPNTFTVKFRMFRYCSGIAFGTSLSNVRVLDNVTNAVVSTHTAPRDSIVQLSFGDECYTPPGLCVQVYYYSTNITLANNVNGYYLTFSECCRNSPIVNIASNTGLWYVQIPDPAIAGGNNSPEFVQYPSDGYFCIGNEKNIDFSCTDADGDSLVYSLQTPLNTSTGGARPFTLTAWNAGFNLLNILGPGSLCIINSATGIVRARPAQLGLYVVAVKCEEYRGGVKIGEVVRDIQYAALNCNYNTLPAFANFPTIEDLEFDKEGCFDIVAIDNDPEDTFFITILSDAYQYGAIASLPTPNAGGGYDFTWNDPATVGPDTVNNLNVRKLTDTDFEGVGRVGVRFCWDLDNCEILGIDSFYVEALGFSIGCDASRDTVRKRVSIAVNKPTYTYKVPNVFSPNGDGINDEFFLKQDAFDRCYDALNVRVYNRWGQQVFESEDAKFSWNGRDENGNELVEGTYFVVLQGFYGGKNVTQNFPLTLFR